MKIDVSYAKRLIFVLILSLVLSPISNSDMGDISSVSFSVYGILFSVYSSFAATFDTRGVRNPDVTKKVREAVEKDLKGSILDFISCIFIYVLCSLFPKMSVLNIYDKIELKGAVVLQVMTMYYIIVLVTKLYGLRELKHKIDDELNK